MSSHQLKRTFISLQKYAHNVNEEYIKHPALYKKLPVYKNNSQYWLFSDLYNIFGPRYMNEHNQIVLTMGENITEAKFKKLPRKNAENILKAPDFHTFYSGHVVSIINTYDINFAPNISVETRTNSQDAKLSRYACWSLFKAYQNMIFAQLYFMMPETPFENIYKAAYKFSRIYQRMKLSQAEKIVNGIAHKNKADLQKFNTFMHNTFFNTNDMEELKSVYGAKGTIFDYMGAQSLMARQIALNNAIRRVNDKTSFDKFAEILYNELIFARTNVINRTGRTPEEDISKRSIAHIKAELKAMERDFINKFAFQSLR